MNDYKPNSHRFKEERKNSTDEKKIKKVVTGNVTTKKRNEVRKLADNFISEETSNIKSYLVNELIIPTIKDTIWSAFTNTLEMILFGKTERSRKSPLASKVSYRSYYDGARDRKQSDRSTPRSRFDLDDIILESRGDAEAVLDQMDCIIDEYGYVSVGDLYEMIDRTAPFTSNNYGWDNLSNAEVVRARGGGYLLKLPRMIVLPKH